MHKKFKMISLRPGQTITYLDCRSTGSSLPWYSVADITLMQNHTLLPEVKIHAASSLEPLQKGGIK